VIKAGVIGNFDHKFSGVHEGIKRDMRRGEAFAQKAVDALLTADSDGNYSTKTEHIAMTLNFVGIQQAETVAEKIRIIKELFKKANPVQVQRLENVFNKMKTPDKETFSDLLSLASPMNGKAGGKRFLRALEALAIGANPNNLEVLAAAGLIGKRQKEIYNKWKTSKKGDVAPWMYAVEAATSIITSPTIAFFLDALQGAAKGKEASDIRQAIRLLGMSITGPTAAIQAQSLLDWGRGCVGNNETFKEMEKRVQGLNNAVKSGDRAKVKAALKRIKKYVVKLNNRELEKNIEAIVAYSASLLSAAIAVNNAGEVKADSVELKNAARAIAEGFIKSNQFLSGQNSQKLVGTNIKNMSKLSRVISMNDASLRLVVDMLGSSSPQILEGAETLARAIIVNNLYLRTQLKDFAGRRAGSFGVVSDITQRNAMSLMMSFAIMAKNANNRDAKTSELVTNLGKAVTQAAESVALTVKKGTVYFCDNIGGLENITSIKAAFMSLANMRRAHEVSAHILEDGNDKVKEAVAGLSGHAKKIVNALSGENFVSTVDALILKRDNEGSLVSVVVELCSAVASLSDLGK